MINKSGKRTGSVFLKDEKIKRDITPRMGSKSFKEDKMVKFGKQNTENNIPEEND